MTRTLAAAVACLALAGCNTFYAEAEQPRICLTLVPRSFVVPVIPPGTTDPVPFSSSVDVGLGDVIPSVLLDGSSREHILRFQGITMTLEGAPGANFGFLHDLDVNVQRGVLAPVLLAAYARGTSTPGAILSLDSLAPAENLTDFLQSGALRLDLTGSVDPALWPSGTTAFSASVTACFSAQVRKTLQELINGN